MERTPLARLFTTKDQYEYLESRAVRFRIRTLIKKKGLFVKDAFRMFNVSESNRLNCSELCSGITWLGLKLTETQIHDIVRCIDKDNDGLLSFVEFKARPAIMHACHNRNQGIPFNPQAC